MATEVQNPQRQVIGNVTAIDGVASARAVFESTWSVVSFVLGSESAWPGFDAESAA